MNKKNIFWGIALILTAVYVIVGRLGLLPNVPIFKLICTVVLAGLVIDGIVKRSIYEILIPIALLLCVYDEQLQITAITPWPVIVAAVLCSIGLDLMFKPVWKKRDSTVFMSGTSHIDNSADGSYVQIQNSFGETSKYVNTECFARAEVRNTFGQCNVYFDHALITGTSAQIEASNSFGEMNLYIPRTWRVHVRKKAVFGTVNMRGEESDDMNAPLVTIEADCSFGEINICFN